MEVYNSSHTAAELEYALGAVPSIGDNGNWFIGDTDTGVFAGGVDVSGAEVGQIIKVAEVDENGRPTAWEAADNVGGEWKLINTITLTEAVREVTISEDSDGKPLSLKEVIVRQNVSCAESSIQNETVYVNGQAVIGKMPIIKNTGYYGWADIVFRIEGGKVMAQCVYSDYTSPTPGAYNPIGVGYNHVTPFANISYMSAEAINNLKFSCEVTTVTFAENSSFTVWGR